MNTKRRWAFCGNHISVGTTVENIEERQYERVWLYQQLEDKHHVVLIEALKPVKNNFGGNFIEEEGKNIP